MPNKIVFTKTELNKFLLLGDTGEYLIDKINPQTAARIILPMTNISKFNKNTKNRIKKYLNLILNSNPSNDVFEVISKSLN